MSDAQSRDRLLPQALPYVSFRGRWETSRVWTFMARSLDPKRPLASVSTIALRLVGRIEFIYVSSADSV